LGGSFHPWLDTGETPIVKKYREGKMKRTSRGGLKLPETVEREWIGDLVAMGDVSSSLLSSLRKRGRVRRMMLAQQAG
jgi:hypothetical protein